MNKNPCRANGIEQTVGQRNDAGCVRGERWKKRVEREVVGGLCSNIHFVLCGRPNGANKTF